MNLDLVRAIPTQYMLLGIAALVAASMGFGYVKGAHHESLKAARFEAATEALGQAAKLRTDAVIKADKLRKETADAENNRTLDSLRADIKRLRDNRASGNFLPAAPAGAGRPDLACFDRALLERAIRDLDKGVQGIVDQCSETTVNLDTAKKWAKTK
jgi:hypothetical protein